MNWKLSVCSVHPFVYLQRKSLNQHGTATKERMKMYGRLMICYCCWIERREWIARMNVARKFICKNCAFLITQTLNRSSNGRRTIERAHDWVSVRFTLVGLVFDANRIPTVFFYIDFNSMLIILIWRILFLILNSVVIKNGAKAFVVYCICFRFRCCCFFLLVL